MLDERRYPPAMSRSDSDGHNHRPVLEVAASGHRVTTLELFFDLVFVFAITQVTGYIAEHLTLVGMLEGMLLLALIWWAWVAYAWLGTTIRFDEGLVRVLLFTAMGMMLVISIGLPEAFNDAPGGFDGWLSTPQSWSSPTPWSDSCTWGSSPSPGAMIPRWPPRSGDSGCPWRWPCSCSWSGRCWAAGHRSRSSRRPWSWTSRERTGEVAPGGR